MPDTETPENNIKVADRQPLTFKLAKEVKTIITKLMELKLNDPTAPGMTVSEEGNDQIAILHGKVPISENTAGQEQTAAKETYLVISPKGLFFANGKSDVGIDYYDDLAFTLKAIGAKGTETDKISIENRKLRIKHDGISQSFNLTEVQDNEEFERVFPLFVESSKKVAQEPILKTIEMGKTANRILDNMIQQEKSASF